jgi:hypothetical protein
MIDPTKLTLALAALTFNGSIIIYLLWRGQSDNSLHKSAMAWSYATGFGVLAGLGILAGLGFGELAPLLKH